MSERQRLISQIETAFAEEMAREFIARTADELPRSYETITVEWLSAILCDKVPGAQVTSITLGPVDNGSSNRRRIYLDYNSEGVAAKLPATVFCKASHDLAHRVTLGVFGAAHAEVTFYNKVRPLLDVEVPVGIFARYDPHSFNSMIVMHDLGPDVAFCDEDSKVDLSAIRRQLAFVARYHAQFGPGTGRSAAMFDLQTWPDFFAQATNIGGEAAAAAGLLAAEAIVPARLVERVDHIWPATVASVALHSSQPQTLICGDCHLKQWYVYPDGRRGLTDWQACTYGNWGRDTAYMMATSLEIEDRRAWEADLIRYYLEQIAENGGAPPSFNEAWLIYRQNMLGALAWWTITLTPPSDMIQDMQPPKTTLKFINRIAHAVDDLQSIDAVG